VEDASRRILNDFAYPVAYPYGLIFDLRDSPSTRRWALCFTVYQALRMVCLPLVGQYLREPIDAQAVSSIAALNTAITRIRSPFFQDWITLLHTLSRHLPRVGLQSLFPALGEALEPLKQVAERPIGLRGERRLSALDAILALRNGTAHGGLPDQAQAAAHLAAYVPVLHEILEAFAFLGNATLRVYGGSRDDLALGRGPVRVLRGATVPPWQDADLPEDEAAAFAESPAILRVPGQAAVPLYPLVKAALEQEPLLLYDGHYGIRVEGRQGVGERSYIYYLGTRDHEQDSAACDHLKAMLAQRQIDFFLDKQGTAPWTIADSARDYSRRTLDDLVGTKYFPACYLPVQYLEEALTAFLRVPDPGTWGRERTRPRYINGFLLIGAAGAGKTAFLARQVEQLLAQTQDDAGRENPNLVLFLRGNALTVAPGGVSLFRDVAERLGVAVQGATLGARRGDGFTSLRELLSHLDQRWGQDRVLGRRCILVLDALNEAPFPEPVLREALTLIELAACYPWCKVVCSIRQEWLGVWTGKLGAQELDPIEALRPYLYVPARPETADGRGPAGRGRAGPPVATLEPLSEAEAAEVYGRYQRAAEVPPAGYRLPACRTVWPDLLPETRRLLTNPLYLHLFMVTFDGRPAEPVTKVPALFQRYIEAMLQERPGVATAVDEVVAHLLQDLARPSADLSDDECHAIRRRWADAHSAAEARLTLSPVEALAYEGLLRKRVREEGGGYRFVFQTVAEYLVYRHLAAARPPADDEGAYWTRRARHDPVFAEYAGAFEFLLRDWQERGRLAQAGPLIEASPRWLQDVLAGVLVEQGRTGYVVGVGSPLAEAAAAALAHSQSRRTATALRQAGLLLRTSRFGLAAKPYFTAARDICAALHAAHPQDVDVADGLARALTDLANLLRDIGRPADAEQTYRQAADIYEALHVAHPERADIADGLARTLNNLGFPLRDAGRTEEAERVYRRAAEIYEALHAAHPDHVEVAHRLAGTLANLGIVLSSTGKPAEAEPAYRRAVEIYEALHAGQPDHVDIAHRLAGALTNLGILLVNTNRPADAERTYRRAIEIHEVLHGAHPEHAEIAHWLAATLNGLGNLLRRADRSAEAERLNRRAVEIYEAVCATHPEHVEAAEGLAWTLNSLGNALAEGGEAAAAQRAYERSLEIRERLHAENPINIEFTTGYADSLCSVKRYAEAKRLVDEVLALVPGYRYANEVARRIARQRSNEGLGS
jgi:tetratricopeptide (TPR) repeat protein